MRKIVLKFVCLVLLATFIGVFGSACKGFGDYVAQNSGISCTHRLSINGVGGAGTWWDCNVDPALVTTQDSLYKPPAGSCGTLVCAPAGADETAVHAIVMDGLGSVAMTGLSCVPTGQDLATQIMSFPSWDVCIRDNTSGDWIDLGNACDPSGSVPCCDPAVCGEAYGRGQNFCCLPPAGFCDADVDCCTPTLGCIQGECQCIPAGQPCSSDACCHGTCSGGTCCGFGGETCFKPDDCCFGFKCDEATSQCCGDHGALCASDAECCAGLHCTLNTCD